MCTCQTVMMKMIKDDEERMITVMMKMIGDGDDDA
jgi:hypothetical protein